ncbi:putative CRISPR-associated endoribonuclease Cas6 [delta proteobacterium NaphS2]|nr:putative CRISPR-associated endoribonuclease Cas6 [delta proteobacterium NaphS2]
MYRVRITLPKRKSVDYRNLDILHDALVNAWVAAGAPAKTVVGPNAGMWHFAALGWRQNGGNRVHTLVVGTPDLQLGVWLSDMNPSDIRYARAATGEAVDFSAADVEMDPDPVAPGLTSLGVVMLSPLVVSRKESGKRRWASSIDEVDLTSAVSTRLSRMAERSVRIKAAPDRLYVRCNPKHDTLIPLKQFPDGRKSFVIGMRVPLVLQGPEEDLRLAWYGGIGEKNRFGFGCIGLAEKGVGR